ncbi:TetR/AcrR family transcriptional regulator [Tenggerimyces flavus]|uniref:TetR/AcrR family transcriptional regulator n=1 Tax=Tenggerimyces flavus TaxID=1708749 RepID=A0ABV7Y5S4_9ACTN|nr:TetR/AcrR family transcriptional regulator [Tenggerimyces flavus]MBM7791118.1 AcrR family transcriptional regulator [Tenggerimyces flavus]
MSPRRSPTPQERQRDPERTRKLILDAAATEFAAHGYAGARISAIASRAGVNQQLISYYFDGKEGLYQAMSELWWQRQAELASPEVALPEQLRRFVLEGVTSPESPRLFAWAGLQYDGPSSDPDQGVRTERLQASVEQLRAAQTAGRLPAEVDPATLLIMLMGASMAATTLPHVIEGVCGVDPRSPEFLRHYADQIALVASQLGLDATPPPPDPA